jgi:hypothetical protein
MSNRRKYCNICSNKFSPRTFDVHKKVCKARQKENSISLPCLCCGNNHDCSYGSGAYCSKTCMYNDRKRYNKACQKCKLTISINNYNDHVKSCQGPKFNVDIWKTSDGQYKCPVCSIQFNKMGIASHYIKTHGALPKVTESIKHKPKTQKRLTCSACSTCGGKLSGKQRKYCSNTCKFKNSKIVNGNYQAQRRRAIKKKLKLVLDFGGKCKRCGYNKNLASLCFHHINEDEKLFTLDARTIAGLGLRTIHAEAEKCELLCHNCHNEHHNPDLLLEKIKATFHWID